jgi:hypothetical protein
MVLIVILMEASIYMPRKLVFIHPVTKDILTVVAAVPSEVLWNAL